MGRTLQNGTYPACAMRIFEILNSLHGSISRYWTCDRKLDSTETTELHPPKVHVQIFYGKDAERYRRHYLAGNAPDEAPYGFHLARDQGFSISFSRSAARNPNRPMIGFFQKLFEFDVPHAYSNRRHISEADVIWTMTEGEAFAIALLFCLRVIPKRPVVANAIWLSDCWKQIPPWRRYIYRVLSKYISVMTVHSAACLPTLREAFPALKSQLMYFGVNTNMFSRPVIPAPSNGGPIRIFAPGADGTRDWNTLFDAFGNDDRFQVTVICWWLGDDKLSQYNNFLAIRDPSMADFHRCYQEADIVTVPMKENIFSGITVALEAVAMGKAVLSSRTGGVPTYFNDDEVFYAPVGDPVAMREIVLSTTVQSRLERAEKAHRRFLETDYSTDAMIRRYAELTRDLLGTRALIHSAAIGDRLVDAETSSGALIAHLRVLRNRQSMPSSR
jgi:glycosyltransferase involved in cell wall biosynthesis